MSGRERLATLVDADHAWSSLRWDPNNITREEVAEIYIEAVRNARETCEKLGTRYSMEPITEKRLVRLGINPETLEPLTPEPEK